MIEEQLAMLRRMRASLVGILELDPEAVATRIVETDWEIDRLTALVETQSEAAAPDKAASFRAIEIVPVRLRAA